VVVVWAVSDQARIERELRRMKEGGIGGVEVQAVYPLALDDESKGLKNLTYLSPEFLDALRFTSQKAKELGMRMDLTIGSGWPYGGPRVTADHAAGRLRLERARVPGGGRRVPLPDLSNGEKLLAAFRWAGFQASHWRREWRADAARWDGRADGCAVFRFEPHGPDGEAGGLRRRGLCAGSLRPEGC